MGFGKAAKGHNAGAKGARGTPICPKWTRRAAAPFQRVLERKGSTIFLAFDRFGLHLSCFRSGGGTPFPTLRWRWAIRLNHQPLQLILIAALVALALIPASWRHPPRFWQARGRPTAVTASGLAFGSQLQ